MLLGIFMTVFWFAIGSMHHGHLCGHLGKLFNALQVLIILGSIDWFLVCPFIFWGFQPRRGYSDYYIVYSERPGCRFLELNLMHYDHIDRSSLDIHLHNPTHKKNEVRLKFYISQLYHKST